MAAEKNQTTFAATQKEETNEENGGETKEEKNNGGYMISASAVYEIAASAASYLHAQTRSILPFKSSDAVEGEGSHEASNERFNGEKMANTEEANLKATTDSVTAVVAANEQVKQVFADDLNSTSSSPCEWFVCDDDQTSTRYFVIQVGHINWGHVFILPYKVHLIAVLHEHLSLEYDRSMIIKITNIASYFI